MASRLLWTITRGRDLPVSAHAARQALAQANPALKTLHVSDEQAHRYLRARLPSAVAALYGALAPFEARKRLFATAALFLEGGVFVDFENLRAEGDLSSLLARPAATALRSAEPFAVERAPPRGDGATPHALSRWRACQITNLPATSARSYRLDSRLFAAPVPRHAAMRALLEAQIDAARRWGDEQASYKLDTVWARWVSRPTRAVDLRARVDAVVGDDVLTAALWGRADVWLPGGLEGVVLKNATDTDPLLTNYTNLMNPNQFEPEMDEFADAI